MPIKKSKKEKENICNTHDCDCKSGCGCHHGCSGAVYGLGIVGSAIYYISNATSFWMGVLGFLKSLIWPVFLVFELLKFVGA
jgi:hypothetical protein